MGLLMSINCFRQKGGGGQHDIIGKYLVPVYIMWQVLSHHAQQTGARIHSYQVTRYGGAGTAAAAVYI